MLPILYPYFCKVKTPVALTVWAIQRVVEGKDNPVIHNIHVVTTLFSDLLAKDMVSVSVADSSEEDC